MYKTKMCLCGNTQVLHWKIVVCRIGQNYSVFIAARDADEKEKWIEALENTILRHSQPALVNFPFWHNPSFHLVGGDTRLFWIRAAHFASFFVEVGSPTVRYHEWLRKTTGRDGHLLANPDWSSAGTAVVCFDTDEFASCLSSFSSSSLGGRWGRRRGNNWLILAGFLSLRGCLRRCFVNSFSWFLSQLECVQFACRHLKQKSTNVPTQRPENVTMW